MCVYRKNQARAHHEPARPAAPPPPRPFPKTTEKKKFIKISCRNSLKFTVACRRRPPAPPRAPGPPTHPPRHRQTAGGRGAAPSLNREVEKLNKLKQQINNTDLRGQPGAGGCLQVQVRPAGMRAGRRELRGAEGLRGGGARPRGGCFARHGPALEAGLSRRARPRALVTASPVGGAGGGCPSKPGPPPGGPRGAETRLRRREGGWAEPAGDGRGRWAEPAGGGRAAAGGQRAGPQQLPSVGRCPARSPGDGLVEVTC